jgi:hypothetical protein
MKQPVFIFFVEKAEWIQLAGTGLFRMNGIKVIGELPPKESISCISTLSGVRVEIRSETFRPSRPGFEGKMISHLKQERSLISKSKPEGEIIGAFLVPKDTNVQVSSFDVEILNNKIKADGKSVSLTGHSVPVQVNEERTLGVLIFHSERFGRVDIIDSPTKLPPVLQLRLLNENVYKGIAFTIQLANKSAEGAKP